MRGSGMGRQSGAEGGGGEGRGGEGGMVGKGRGRGRECFWGTGGASGSVLIKVQGFWQKKYAATTSNKFYRI